MHDETTSASEVAINATIAEEVVAHAASLAAAEMPLPAGLKAAAAESDSPRIAAALRSIAGEIEYGRSLDDCLANARQLPPYVAGLIRAAQRTGDTGLTLSAWTENRRSVYQYWRTVLAALAYPTLSLLLALAIFLLFQIEIVPIFRRMFEEFGLKLPAATEFLFRTTKFFELFLLPLVTMIAALAIGMRLVGGKSGWSWLVGTTPLLGKVWHWMGVAEMLRGLGLLVRQRVPLPEALRLTAGAISDGYVATQCQKLAERVEGGSSLTMSLIRLRTLPLSIVPLVRWGEQHNALDEALHSAAEMIEGRLRMRTTLLALVVPPLVFVFVAISVASTFVSLFLPLISLIQGLS
jgi:type II secretory pathway component PulF